MTDEEFLSQKGHGMMRIPDCEGEPQEDGWEPVVQPREETMERPEFVEKEQVDRPVLKLIGGNGNAFAILGKARSVARKAGWPKEQIEEFTTKATSGNYDHLLRTCIEYFDVE